MGVTIYDIAREAKVGIGTVSRALNNHPKIADKTKARILDISRRMNYQPHAYAQGLARRKTNTIALLIPFFTNYFFIEVLQGIQDRIADLGYDLMLFGVNQTDQAEQYIKRAIYKGKADGMLYFSMKFKDDFAKMLKDSKIPIVLVDTFHPSFDSITIQNEDGAFTATSHLIELGYKKIGMIDALLESEPAKQRFNGFKRAIQSGGYTFNENYFIVSKHSKNDGFNREAGYSAMMELLDKNKYNLPEAVFVSSDIQAIGALNALKDKGLRVPEDMAIIGFDDIELARHFDLTTMRQPMYQMGVIAIEKLMHRIQNNDFPPSHTTFSPTLVIRNSCGGNRVLKIATKEGVHDAGNQ